MRRGEIWWAEVPDTGRRPFLVLTREAAIPVLHSVVAAPVTRAIRGIPTELALSRDGASSAGPARRSGAGSGKGLSPDPSVVSRGGPRVIESPRLP